MQPTDTDIVIKYVDNRILDTSVGAGSDPGL